VARAGGARLALQPHRCYKDSKGSPPPAIRPYYAARLPYSPEGLLAGRLQSLELFLFGCDNSKLAS